MKKIHVAVLALSGLSVLPLAACGEGYEMVKIRGTVPYTEGRTAGPGVAYVRAHMMSEKTVVLPEPLLTPQLAPAPLPAPVVEDAAPIFDLRQNKK